MDFKGEVVTMWANREERPIKTNIDGDNQNKTLRVSLNFFCINCWNRPAGGTNASVAECGTAVFPVC